MAESISILGKLTAGQKTSQDFASLLKARNSLFWIVTREEPRAERILAEGATSASYQIRFQDCATGLTDLAGEPIGAGEDMIDPDETLRAIRDSRDRAVWVLRDFASWLKSPATLRRMRSLARSLPLTPRDQARAIVVLTTDPQIPAELQGHAVAIDLPLPDREELSRVLDARIAALPEEIRASAAPNGTRDAAIDAAIGLTESEASSCFARSLVLSRTIDPATIAGEKRRVITREKILEWFDPDPRGLDAIGGLDALKTWIKTRRSAFTPKARAFGLPAPKGVIFVGPPGCGKSLASKTIPTALGMPLLRLDPGALRNMYVGKSEENARKAFRVAETIAPCVLWIDEGEKAFAGATQGAADGGVSADLLGVFLSWMQDRSGDVFVVMTCNDISKLPPEMLRKGRFDEIFYVGLPNDVERAEILRATLKTYKRTAEGIDVASFVRVTEGFVGAEIAACVTAALFPAFEDGERAIRTDDLIAAARETVPLVKTAPEKIRAVEDWAKAGRARPATSPTVKTSQAGGALDL
jgi:adenylate kinase family enzyme